MRVFKIILLSVFLVGSLIGAGITDAKSYSYGDIYWNWPGYESLLQSDENGPPTVSGAQLETYGNSSYLKSVTIFVEGRKYGDGLFINANWLPGENYSVWDYYINGWTDGPLWGWNDYAAVYSVDNPYVYTFATTGRVGHPNGIESQYLHEQMGIVTSFVSDWAANTLTYTFADNTILLGDYFVFGYTSLCANDVFLTPVPEPTTMLLLGLGMTSMAFFKRRKK